MIEDGGTILFHVQKPVQDMAAVKSCKREIFMICVNEMHSIKKYGSELIKDHNIGEEFLEHGIVVSLQLSQFT